MSEILLDKKEALRISVSILNKEKAHDDYGFTALKEAELILKNILETLIVEEELLAIPTEQPKPKAKPKKPNKKLHPHGHGDCGAGYGECGGVDHDAASFAARSRSTYLRTFPEALVGSSETISTLRGTL